MKRLFSTLSSHCNKLGGQIIYDKLLENGVKDVFLYSGGAIMPVVDKFYKGPINYIVNSHEQNCGHAATGYARSSNRTGVVITTSGPGLTNTVTPILDAQNDSTPLVVFSGQVPIKAMGTRAFQECPAIDITKSITKWNHCVKDVRDLPNVIDTAFKIANDGKKGAVHIDLPKCITSSVLTDTIGYEPYNVPSTSSINQVSPDTIVEIAAAINGSNSPVLYIGQGCNDSSEKLRLFAKKTNIPVTTTIHALGSFDETDELSLKFLGMHGNPAANYAIQNADCIIALGCRFDDRTTGNMDLYAPKAKTIVYCNIEPAELELIKIATYPVVSDCGDFMDLLMPCMQFKDRTNWLNQINIWKQTMPLEYIQDDKLRSEMVIQCLNEHMDHNNTIITTGVGNHQMQTAQYITWKSPKSFISSGSLGTMGFGLPASIGVKIANPDKTVIDIDGDSSFLMTMSDLKTIKEHNLDIKIFIMNNHVQGMVTIWEKLFFNERYAATINKCNPQFCKLANAFGIESLYCDNKDNLEKTVKYALNHKGPLLCEFDITYAECLPLMAPGKALDDLILFREYTGKLDIKNMLPPS